MYKLSPFIQEDVSNDVTNVPFYTYICPTFSFFFHTLT